MREYIAAQYNGEFNRVFSADVHAAMLVAMCIAIASVVRVAFAAMVECDVD
jgi:hypothetical protein